MDSINLFKFELSGFEKPLQINVETSGFIYGSGVTALLTIPIFLLSLAVYAPFITALLIVAATYSYIGSIEKGLGSIEKGLGHFFKVKKLPEVDCQVLEDDDSEEGEDEIGDLEEGELKD